MGLTLPVTIGVKAVTPNAAFLDQMWVAGIVLFALLAVLSLTDPNRVSLRSQHDRMKESEKAELAHQLPERDLLFDVLSIGAVVATVALVLFFW